MFRRRSYSQPCIPPGVSYTRCLQDDAQYLIEVIASITFMVFVGFLPIRSTISVIFLWVFTKNIETKLYTLSSVSTLMYPKMYTIVYYTSVIASRAT